MWLTRDGLCDRELIARQGFVIFHCLILFGSVYLLIYISIFLVTCTLTAYIIYMIYNIMIYAIYYDTYINDFFNGVNSPLVCG